MGSTKAKTKFGVKCPRTYPLLGKNLLQPPVVLAEEHLLVLHLDGALRKLAFVVADQIMHILYFLVQLTKRFLEKRQPAAGVSHIQNNLGHVVLNLGKMQLLGMSTDRKQTAVTTAACGFVMPTHQSAGIGGFRFCSQVCATNKLLPLSVLLFPVCGQQRLIFTSAMRLLTSTEEPKHSQAF